MAMRIKEHLSLSEVNLQNRMTLQSVKICGLKSKNNREYPLHVLEQAANLYEGQPVCLNHSDKTTRKYEERVGHITRVCAKADGLYGDLVINPHHPLAESLWWDFSNSTQKIGISHVVEAEMAGRKITKITQVRHVDIVNDPATTTSLKEETEMEDEEKLDEMPDEEQEDEKEDSDYEKCEAEITVIKAEMEALKAMIESLKSEIEASKVNTKAEEQYKRRPVAIAPSAKLPEAETISEFAKRLTKRKK